MFNKTSTYKTPEFNSLSCVRISNPDLQDPSVNEGSVANSFEHNQVVASFPNLNPQMNTDWSRFQISIIGNQMRQRSETITDNIQTNSKKRKRDEESVFTDDSNHPLPLTTPTAPPLSFLSPSSPILMRQRQAITDNIQTNSKKRKGDEESVFTDDSNHPLPLTTPTAPPLSFLSPSSPISTLEIFKSSIFTVSPFLHPKPSIFNHPSHEAVHPKQQLSQREQYLFNAYSTLSSDKFTDREYQYANQMMEQYIACCGDNNFLDDMKKVLLYSKDSYEWTEPDDQIPFQSLKSFCLFFGLNPPGIEKFQLDSKTQKYVLGKLHSAAKDQQGEFLVEGQEYPCEGMNGCNTTYGFMYFLTQELNKYFEDCKTTKNPASDEPPLYSCTILNRLAPPIMEAFDLTSRFHSATELATRIREKKLCVISSGYVQHAICVVFANEMMFVCNNCNDSINNIVCYPIDSQKVNEEAISKLIEFKMNGALHDPVCSFIYTELPEKLSRDGILNESTEMQMRIINKQITNYFAAFNLQAGTCVFQSFVYAVFVALFISSLYDNKDLSSASTLGGYSQAAQNAYLFVKDFIFAMESSVSDRWMEETDEDEDQLSSTIDTDF
jgi:hypothetical protein